MGEAEVLAGVRARASRRLAECCGRMGDDSVAECWSAILNAANDLDPPLHEAITRPALHLGGRHHEEGL